MNFLKDPKTNWKYILIVVILAVFINGGILYCYLKFPEVEFPPIFPLKGEKYCEQNSDCKLFGHICDCLSIEYMKDKEIPAVMKCTKEEWENTVCICVNNHCQKSRKQVTIATDKTEYEQGEIVKIVVRNGLDKSIWDFGICGSRPWWGLQKFEEDQWKEINFSFPISHFEESEFCHLTVCEKPELKELKPDSEINYYWKLGNICQWDLEPVPVQGEIIEKGIYRVFLIYGFNKDFSFPEGETIYSNEFTIK